MKKRLLITSIVMMLVVAVALSTATYAWFTSNTSVKADAVLLTASTMDGEAILITHNADGSGAQQTITLSAHELAGQTPTPLKLYPATPTATTSFTTFTSSIDNIGANFQNLIMNGTGTYVDPEIESPNVSFYKDTFYVFNKGYQSTTLVPTISIYYIDEDNTSEMAAKSVRVAIIERVPSAEVALESAITANMSAYTLKGIWQYDTTAASTTTVEGQNVTYNKKNTAVVGANTGYGVVAGANSTFTQGAVNFTSVVSEFTAIGAATSGKHIANEYTVVVWLEGWDADCTNAITAGTFKVDVSFGTVPRNNNAGD